MTVIKSSKRTHCQDCTARSPKRSVCAGERPEGTVGQAMRGAGGSRTRFCGFADRRLAVRLRHLERRSSPTLPEAMSSPGIEPGLRPSQSGVRGGFPSHPEDTANSACSSPGPGQWPSWPFRECPPKRRPMPSRHLSQVGIAAPYPSSVCAGEPPEGNDGADDERRRRESNPLLRFCRPPPGRQAPAP